MSSSICELYPRTLYLWTKSDDKKLLSGVLEGESLLVIAEVLGREHVSVVNRLNDLELFQFDRWSEEWVEVMTLALGGAPLNAVIDWCNGAESRLQFADLEASLMGDFRAEFELARELAVDVCSFQVMSDLSWLLAQPQEVRAGYAAAAAAVAGRFDILTPATLKAQVLGLVPANSPWPIVLEARLAKGRRTASRKAPRKKTYRRRTSSAYSKRGGRKAARRPAYA